MYKNLQAVVIAGSLLLGCASVNAADARSLALGGSVIANAQGANGAMENPASMMAMKRANEKTHFRFSVGTDFRIGSDIYDTLSDPDNQTLVGDISDLIDRLNTQDVLCDPISGAANDICVDNTQPISDLATRLLDIMTVIDDENYDLRASADFGMAFTSGELPFAFNFTLRGTAASNAAIPETDRAYIQEFADLFDGGTLTLDEVRNSTFLEVNELGIPLAVLQPEDILESSGIGSAMVRSQLGVSFASTLTIAGYDIDAGITPKVSQLTAYNVNVNIADEFRDDGRQLSDDFRDSEVVDSSFTLDLGASMQLNNQPIRVAAVLRNVIPESIKTMSGFEFETTPQLILGGVFQSDIYSINADIALNEGKVDNYASQLLSLGTEFGSKKFALRAGLSHDLSMDNDPTALMLGLGVGPVQLAARVNGALAINAALQLAYSF